MRPGPLVISTWNFSLPAATAAWKAIVDQSSALDAVETGIAVCEADGSMTSVGASGLPDASGRVTLDASIMDADGACGAVACLSGFRHPIRVARRVMETTPHVLLVGTGAEQFAAAHGFETWTGLSDEAARQYERWRRESGNRPPENHDTIGLLAIDSLGRMAGGCSTSGTAWKLPGRVGDSPIIGAGLYVDGAVGTASATGVGEVAMRVCGSFAIVEQMRRGATPSEAIAIVLERIRRQRGGDTNVDISFIACRVDGIASGMTLRPATRFQYAMANDEGVRVIDVPALS